ncbi:hypothetical protein C882_1391 [Caenispirillum salinarum AK4]|uniref:Holin n=1 Tax=Caenispirillum salinarum AK4 TaxID=1238182 RepID=K9GNK4_9PROT|nr:hypothetical protein [Caenispirillum salinarum]EKV27545.1 hypothetical protein C882_1391 [Caenispirillum salinarum AK4]
MDEQTKPWWQSRAVWGGIVALGATILQAINPQLQLDDETRGGLVDALLAVAQGAGALMAIYGRVAAKNRVSVRSGPQKDTPPTQPNAA